MVLEFMLYFVYQEHKHDDSALIHFSSLESDTDEPLLVDNDKLCSSKISDGHATCMPPVLPMQVRLIFCYWLIPNSFFMYYIVFWLQLLHFHLSLDNTVLYIAK